MKTESKFHCWNLNFTAAGTAVAVLYWLTESVLHAFVWNETSFWEALHGAHDSNELIMRIIIIVLMIGFGWLTEQGKRHYQAIAIKQAKLNRLLLLLSECNQNVQRQLDEPSLMDAACKAAVEVGKFKFAWIGLQRPEGFRLVTWASSDPTLNEHVILLEEHASSLACLGCQKVLREGIPQICDLASKVDCPAKWREAFLRQGCKLAYALPITISGKVVGVFEIYAGESGSLSQEELTILDEVASDISIALSNIYREIERKEKDKELHRRVDELERFQDATADREFRIKELRDENTRLKARK